MVASRISGKALLVPVERAQMGVSAHRLATTRFVPSPPSTAIALTPCLRIFSTASTVSRASWRRRISTSSSSGKDVFRRRGRAGRVGVRRRGRSGRHHQDALDADRSEADHEAVDHVALLDVVEDRGARHQPSDVAPGGGVGDDTDGYEPVTGRSQDSALEEVGNQAVHHTRRLHLHRVALAVDDIDASVVGQVIGVGGGDDVILAAPDGEYGNV